MAAQSSSVAENTSILADFIWSYTHAWLIVWVVLELFIILALILVYKKFPNSSVSIFFDMCYEKVYNFFEDLLWREEKRWLKVYSTLLFFIILFSNLLWVLVEFLIPINEDFFHHAIRIPSSDINFNVAMAVVWISIVIFEQFRSLWLKKFFYEYFPLLWKDYIPFEKGKLPKYIDIPAFLLIKLFDIIISLFLWLLEIIWLAAKVISLAFRLFWNITAWWILLIMLVWWATALSQKLFWINFPVIIPLIVYLQEILVSFIQAFVFPLLIAIFVKVAKMH